MEQYVLSVDCGTQSIRALLFDEKGTLHVKVKKPIDFYVSEEVGLYEADAEKFYAYIKEVCIGAKAADPGKYAKIAAVSLTTLRDSSVLVGKDGKPIRRAIIWHDNRLAENVGSLDPVLKTVFSAVGMRATIDKLRKTSQALWYKSCEPENWKKAHKFLLLSTYLNFRLTGEFADSDASVVGHIPYNYQKRNWDKPNGIKSKIFPIEREKLCEIRPSCTVIGRLAKSAAEDLGLPEGLPVAGAGTDKACETIGVGCTDNACGSISLGSQATIGTTAARYYEIEPFFTPFASVKQKALSPEFTLYRGFWLVKWFEEQFANEEVVEAKKMGTDPILLLNERLQNVPVGCDGLLLQPFWGQELTRPDARGCMIGFSDKHTRIHVYRAIIEGIGYAMLDGIHRIEKVSGVKMEKLALSGGGSQSDEICQIAANIFGRKVYRVQTYETSGLGAAIAAFCALGVYADIDAAVDAMVHPTDYFKPQKEESEIYALYYNNVYKNIYNRLKPLYKTITEIEKEAGRI